MIKAIEIEGFRSLRSVRFELRPFNVLIGPNQSGKTNILDALDLLSQAVQGRLTTALYRSRGGLAHLLWAGDGERRIRFGVAFPHDKAFDKGGEPLEYGLTIEEQAAGHVIAEEFLKVLPTAENQRESLQFAVRRGTFFSNDPVLGFIAVMQHEPDYYQEPTIGPIGLKQFDKKLDKDLPREHRVYQTLKSITIYPGFETKARWTCDHPNDTPQIRQPQFVQHATLLEPNGENLVNVLYTLSQDEDRWKDFKEVVRIGFPDFENIQFPADAGQGRIALAWIDRRFPRKRFTAEVLSDGTLSFLALAATLASPDRPTLIAFDEPERHLHPDLLYRAVGLLEKASANRQIIVATHSDALLSYLSDPTSVVLVNNGPQGTTLTRPPEADLREWLKDYTLGDLREAGHLAAFASSEE